LLDLPVELLFDIHVLAKNPSLPLVNRTVYTVLHNCPCSIKARYLIARWHEAYCYGFTGTLPRTSSKRQPVPNRPPLPSADLIENGALVELSWSSRFLPVLPSSGFPYPLSNSAHRSADHFVLDYCLRYRLTDLEVLHACEEIVLRSPEFGNIVSATGLWRDTDGYLHTHEIHSKDGQEDFYVKAEHLRITELPKRLFQMRKSNSQGATLESLEGLDNELRDGLSAFGQGKGSCPPLSDLMTILAIVALHLPSTSAGSPAVAVPFNSFEGLPLAKATVVKSPFMVQLLLALGAEPMRKTCIALYIAIRTGWLEGLQQLVERSPNERTEWGSGLKRIRSWFQRQEIERRHDWRRQASRPMQHVTLHTKPELANSTQSASEPSSVTESSSPAPNGLLSANPRSTPSKRRKLLDRASLDSKMLKEAVKYNHWTIANWIRSKGVIPDLRTIKLIELKQQKLDEQS
jgi:hypothetical protein